MLRVLALLATAPLSVLAGVQELWWNITYVESINPDGLFPRRVIGLNGTWPPPPIQVDSNDTLIVHAYNGLDEPSSIHHHGMFFNSTSWMDGAMSITQCGIPPGQTFDYVVPINSSGQHGTFWAHSHAPGQYPDGLRMPFNIHMRDNSEPYANQYDDEYTVVLGDWYHEQHAVLIKQFISRANPGGAEPVPDSGLIYFVHGNETKYLPPIEGTTSGAGNVGFNENATLPFQPGKTYRLRVVNTSTFAMFHFWIDGHDMEIIEVDGIDTKAFPVDNLMVTVAQRYSLLVRARNDTSANYAIHANMDIDMFDTVPDALNPNITSSITYSTSASLTNNPIVDEYPDVNDTALVPLDVIPQFAPADKTIELEFSFDTMNDGTNRAMFNQRTYTYPNVPPVLSALTLGPNATVETAYGPLTEVVDHLDSFELFVKNADAGKHPFHLHGHKFQIVQRIANYSSEDPSENPPLIERQENPVRRDTVEIPAGGAVRLRLIADNPGVWIFHCHIEWHLSVGLAMVIIEAPLEMQQRARELGPPSFMNEQCAALGLPYAGNAAGHASATDLTGLNVGPSPQNNGWHSRGIGALVGCILTALIGMGTVVWYTLGGEVSEEQMEDEARRKLEAKERRGKLWGLMPGKRT